MGPIGNRLSIPKNLALRVFRIQDFVGAVAACAGGGNQQAVTSQSKPVNGIDVKRVDVRESILFRHLRISMAGPAGARQVQRVNRGTGVMHGNDGVGIPMAIQAGGRRRVIHHRVVHAGVNA